MKSHPITLTRKVNGQEEAPVVLKERVKTRDEGLTGRISARKMPPNDVARIAGSFR